MQYQQAFRLRSCETAAAGVDEGADAEEDVDEAEETEGGLGFYGCGIGEGDAIGEAKDVDHGGDHPEKDQQGNSDGDVHPEHALFAVFGVGHDAEEDEEEADACGDQSCWMRTAGGDETEDAEQDEQNAEADGQFSHDEQFLVERSIRILDRAGFGCTPHSPANGLKSSKDRG